MTREQRPNQFFTITNPRTGKSFEANPKRVWRFFPETMEKVIAEDRIIWPDEAEGNLERPRFKTYFEPENSKSIPVSSWIETANVNDRDIEIDEAEFGLEIIKSGMNQEGGRIVDHIFGSRRFAYPKPVSLIRSLIRASTRNSDIVLDFFAGSGTSAHATISLNREDGGTRKFIQIEMGEHFDAALMPRIMKVVYSLDWKDGKPVARSGSSALIRIIRLESYEDTLDNLALTRTDSQDATLMTEGSERLREDYLLRYMLDVESQTSLLNPKWFEKPSQMGMTITRDDDTKRVNVDLVETFNYLLGLRVRTMRRLRGVYEVVGTDPSGDRVLILWRDLDEVSNSALETWFDRQQYNSRDMEFDLIYINGDNTIENLRRPDQSWKVRLIEEAFHELMFADEN